MYECEKESERVCEGREAELGTRKEVEEVEGRRQCVRKCDRKDREKTCASVREEAKTCAREGGEGRPA